MPRSLTVFRPIRQRATGAVAMCALVLAAMNGPADAQTPSPSPTPGSVTLELIDQPVWHAPQDGLDLRLRVTNEGPVTLEGFRIVVGIYDRVTTRSGLNTPPASTPPSSLPFEQTASIEPGGAVEVTVDEPISAFPTIAATSAGGVYPATFGLTTLDGVSLATSNTWLVYYPQPPEVRLNLSLLLPLNLTPERLPDGAFISADDGGSLPAAISGSGWLSGYLDALLAATEVEEPAEEPRRGKRGRRARPAPPPPPDPLKISIAPTARLVEELDDLRDGATTTSGEIPADDATATDAENVLGELRSLLARPEVQAVLTPYAFPDIPSLVDSGISVEHLAQQNTTAKKILRESLAFDSIGAWYFPPAGRLDASSLSQLQVLDEGRRLLLGHRSVEPLDVAEVGCPDLSQSFTCGARIRTIQGTSEALIADEGLTDILAELPGTAPDRLALQRFFAETAMIREEVPGVTGRVIHATLPSQWHPSPGTTRLFFQGLRDAPWLRTLTAEEALEAAAEIAAREIDAEADPISNQPDPLFFDRVERSQSIVDSYGQIVPSTNQRITRLRRNLLVSTSRSWWRKPADGERYLEGSEQEVATELEKISIETPPGFTFTDRQGELQFRVTNDTGYPVRLSLRLLSPNLTLSQNGMTDVYPPGSRLIRVEAEARTSGDFPIAVRLTTPDGYAIDEEVIRLRSTSLNRIALMITVGAFIFTLFFYAWRSIRRKRAQADETSTG